MLGTWEGKKTTHMHGGEGEKGNGVWWGFLQMFKNFSAKNLACRKTKTDDLSVPATERSNPTASTDGAAVLPCLHTELTGLSRWIILPLIQPKHMRFLLLSCISGGR